ncbi:CCR4-NOT transcription complex subunit 3 isoform X1 [Drosophila elegans]|uniref:CCR4-NOT transcription complex subunit 3 isoform X1 n=1 Tax=Drosophila elegans TaxID=30023 RepID=UPI0007E8827E|nr:CCR4-NOT transcription complex subunit 3 isoform X1 [Drosophila elegans]XP_017120819.1 CCR4-NOT transcription complex subunit 3 isoform X1 [Drosophila elegans]XP_017120828.1 CCR4-NOT transcription complex subunit 3 isoform X1 [Drosophila elegans]XP_017120838.1 CCR4-NOT transcription complex subunit 3 isoform X1 [Drosophila elegans]
MAATRKLQGEIDRCLKKVAEGVETFEDIWKKVHNATNTNQKQKHLQEKYEADLKKEIKKLQRLRDQIKSWIASAEIKDKSALLENRRLIETQMERFKVVERETKTKAYSKEGLGAAQKMDPAQRIKDDARNWLTSSISSLQIQIDQYESEIESLLAGKKKRLDRDKQERMDDLRGKLDRHKFHISKLETLLRLLDNDGVEAEQVNKIKDDVEYYIDSSQEPDFEENEFIYDDIIGLDEVELSGTATTDSNNSNETSGSPSSVTSGGSPSQSPVTVQQILNTSTQALTSSGSSAASATLFQQQQQALAQSNGNNIGYASDTSAASSSATTSTDPTGSTAVISCGAGGVGDKRNKNSESNAISKLKPQPQQLIKPTPLRPTAKLPLSSDASVNKIVSSTPSKNHLHIPSASSIVATPSLSQNNSTGNGSGNSTTGTGAAQSASSSHNPAVQPHAPTPGLSAATSAVLNSSPIASSVTVQGPSVIQATPTIAFAAVAKHSSSLLENGPALPLQQALAPTVASIVGAGAQAQQQQATHLSNLQTNSSLVLNGLPVSDSTSDNGSSFVDTISLKTMAQEAIDRSAIDTNLQNKQQTINVDTRQQQSLLQQSFISETTANQQQQQVTSQHQQQQLQNTTVAAAAIGSIAAPANAAVTSNGPSTGSGLLNLPNAAGQPNSGNAKVHSCQHQQMPTTEAHIPTLLGVTPLGPTPLQKEHQMQFQMMEAAYYHLPQPMDTEKLQTYFHRAPVPTPAHYPQAQLPIYDTVEFYQRLSTETLFFVFYYMEGSKAQYLAAKALKKQSWRFHTKYMMWFQRHEEPKIINDDYEQGTYIYFDYEKWSQRKKEGFTFEYKYLEDKELN